MGTKQMVWGSGRKTVPEMEQTMMITKEVKKMKDSLVWGCVNAAILAIVAYDIVYTCPLYTTTAHMIEHAVAIILLLNTLFHFSRYFWTSMTLQPVVLSPKQKSLLGIKESDYYIRTATSTPVKPKSPQLDPPMCVTPLNMSTNSWLSSSILSHCDPNESMTSGNLNSSSTTSWLYQSKSSPPTPYQSPILATSEVIQDESALQQYLREFESLEKSSVVENSMEQPSNMLSGFWSHPASRTATDISPLLRRCTYQMSLSPAQAQSGVGSGDETGSPSPYQYADVWRKNKINPALLTEWTANLRMWISQTILERLVSEIRNVDEALHAQGLVDISIGVVGLERLNKTAQIPQVALNIPSLARLVPFLDLTQNQEYLVSRIKELARGGCMSEYRWNGGGVWGGKEWAPPLPTDAALVLHLLATYLDCQLPQTSLPDSRPFSSHHLVRLPHKPMPGQLCIMETSTSPPNYILQTKTETFHTPKGRNNLFFTILLFLHTVKTKDHGILGRINLGRSGINMLWTIDSDS
uniref:Transmembrane protein 209 n=1 Tax=Cuerna arida TaxID=1464854 RepID=A0A1B6FSW8_9HEMI